MITAEALRTIKQFICTKIELISNVGYVVPTRQRFTGEGDFWAILNSANDTQDEIETTAKAFVLVHLLNPFAPTDPQNQKVFDLVYLVRAFRQAFKTKVDEADAFETKIFLSEDIFDAVCVNIGNTFKGFMTIGGLDADYKKVTTKPIDPQDVIQFGEVENLPGVAGSYLDFLLSVEVIYDDC